MERIEVASSQIKSIGWVQNLDEAGSPLSMGSKGKLQVQFTSLAVYQYADVPYVEYRKLLAADSKGQHFANHIRESYPYVCIFKPERAVCPRCGRRITVTRTQDPPDVPLNEAVSVTEVFAEHECKPLEESDANPDLTKELKKSIRQVKERKAASPKNRQPI